MTKQNFTRLILIIFGSFVLVLSGFEFFSSSAIYITMLLYPIFLAYVLSEKKMICGLFLFFMYMVPLVAFIQTFLMGLDFVSWRRGLIFSEENIRGLLLLTQYLIVAGLTFLVSLQTDKRSIKIIKSHSVLSTTFASLVMLALLFFPILVYVFYILGGSRDSWVLDADGSSILLVNLSFVIIYTCASYFIFYNKSGYIWYVGLYLTFVVSVVYALSGFRYVLVGVIIIFGLYYMQSSSIDFKKVFKWMPIIIIIYIFFIIIALSRNLNLGGAETVSLIVTGKMPFDLLYDYFGAHEQILYYSYIKILNYNVALKGEGYFDAIIRVLPSFIYSSLFDTVRVNDQIFSIVAPEHMQGTNLNVGAFFVVEAILNFGKYGAFLVVAIFVFFAARAEVFIRSSVSAIIYFVVAASMPNFVYYGLNGFIKTIVYALLVLMMVKVLAGLGVVNRK